MRIVLCLILLFMTKYASARTLHLSDSGGWSGNGGGLQQIHDNVWYLGEEPIRYCVRVGESFPVGMDQMKTMVRRTFGAWQQFFRRYQIGQGPIFPDTWPGFQPLMTMSSREVDCQDKPELEFYFGLDNETLRLYRQVNESDGFGLALRQVYDHAQHRHQGYVWIPAFDQDPRKIEHMLLHELGHVFGMKHDTVFVMDRDIALMLKGMTADHPAASFLTRIEAEFWPYDLTVGSRVRLEPYVRQLPMPGMPAAAYACQAGSLSLAIVPFEFHPGPPLLPSPCVRLVLQKNNDQGENNFQLNMETEYGGWLMTVFGTFQALQPGNEESMVPGTLSTWQNLAGKKPQWLYVPYARRNMHAQLSGFFIRGQSRYPAKLSWSRGLTLEIFLPAQGRWWSIRSF